MKNIFPLVVIVGCFIFVIIQDTARMKKDIVSLTLDIQEARNRITEEDNHLILLYSQVKKLDYQIDVLSNIIHDRKP